MEHTDHLSSLYPKHRTVGDGCGGCHPNRLTGRNAFFPQKVALTQQGCGCFFAPMGHNRELHFAALNIEYRVTGIPLREHNLLLWDFDHGPAQPSTCEEPLG